MPTTGTKWLTTAERARIAALHRMGRSTAQIAAEMGKSIHQVRAAMKRAGLKPSGGKGGTIYHHADELRAWANQGIALAEMGRRIGASHSKIRQYFERHGIPYVRFRQAMENNPAWKGGRMLDKSGYVLIRMPDHPAADSHGYVREHRLVMERHLGRPLQPSEVVHHKDGNRENNNPSNLELFQTNAEHLAETLAGQNPQWTEEGRRKIEERWNRLSAERRETIRRASEQDGPPLRRTNGQFVR